MDIAVIEVDCGRWIVQYLVSTASPHDGVTALATALPTATFRDPGAASKLLGGGREVDG